MEFCFKFVLAHAKSRLRKQQQQQNNNSNNKKLWQRIRTDNWIKFLNMLYSDFHCEI